MANIQVEKLKTFTSHKTEVWQGGLVRIPGWVCGPGAAAASTSMISSLKARCCKRVCWIWYLLSSDLTLGRLLPVGNDV